MLRGGETMESKMVRAILVVLPYYLGSGEARRAGEEQRCWGGDCGYVVGASIQTFCHHCETLFLATMA